MEITKIKENIGKVVRGKDAVVDLLLICLGAGGSVLLEDAPGMGKTTLAKALAKSIGGVFRRVQFTPDLLPSDILGASIYNPRDGNFQFHPGPVFANILLADEINRASPRTQSALLEAMSERQATIEGVTHPLPAPFMVLATENPIEYHGTYPLPEAQLDRFAMRLEIGYPAAEHELEMLFARRGADPLDFIGEVATAAETAAFQAAVSNIEISREVAEYGQAIIAATRRDSRVRLGASPRAFLCLARCAQARAAIDGREFTTPGDFKSLAAHVLAHRLVMSDKARHAGAGVTAVVEDILAAIPVPV